MNEMRLATLLTDVKTLLFSGALIGIGNGRAVIGWGTQKWLSEPRGFSFYFPDFFFENPAPWLTFEQFEEISLQELSSQFPSYPLPSLKWQEPNWHLFEEAFADIQQKFARGELSKAVPFVYETAQNSMTTDILGYVLGQMLDYAQAQPVYPYGFWNGEGGMLGATPELLFKVSGNRLETMVCAGTRSNNDNPNKLLNDPKELHEHYLVRDGIIESLSPFGEVHVGKMGLLELPTLSHLLTPVQVTLSDQPDIQTLVRALHPTPALGAFPRNPGSRWLKTYQTKIDRRRFGAPAGFYNPITQEMTCYVAIRNMQWQLGNIMLGAGCGVVPQSKLENERREIELKINSIKRILGL